MLIVATYDIADDRRRHRVSLCLEAQGARVQYSVFECDLKDRRAASSLRDKIENLIDPNLDQVRFYTLGSDTDSSIDIVGERRLEEREEFYIV